LPIICFSRSSLNLARFGSDFLPLSIHTRHSIPASRNTQPNLPRISANILYVIYCICISCNPRNPWFNLSRAKSKDWNSVDPVNRVKKNLRPSGYTVDNICRHLCPTRSKSRPFTIRAITSSQIFPFAPFSLFTSSHPNVILLFP